MGVDREESAQPLQGGFVGDAFVPDEAGVEGAPAAVAFGPEMNGNGDDAVPSSKSLAVCMGMTAVKSVG